MMPRGCSDDTVPLMLAECPPPAAEDEHDARHQQQPERDSQPACFMARALFAAKNMSAGTFIGSTPAGYHGDGYCKAADADDAAVAVAELQKGTDDHGEEKELSEIEKERISARLAPLTTTGVTLCVIQGLLSIAWAGLVGEATQHAYFDGSAELSASDRGLWVSSLESRGVTYALSLITCGLLIYTTLHVYDASPHPPSIWPWALTGVAYFVASLLLMGLELAPTIVPSALPPPSTAGGAAALGPHQQQALLALVGSDTVESVDGLPLPSAFFRGASTDFSRGVPPVVVVAVSICSVLTNLLTFAWNGCTYLVVRQLAAEGLTSDEWTTVDLCCCA